MLGREITVTYPRDTGRRTPGNQIIWEDGDTETVPNVLVAPNAGADATDAVRPDGDDATCTFYMPRTWTWRSLRGATIRWMGDLYRVNGDPKPYGTDMTPTGWQLAVPATIAKG